MQSCQKTQIQHLRDPYSSRDHSGYRLRCPGGILNEKRSNLKRFLKVLKVLKALRTLRNFKKTHNFAVSADREPERFGSFFFCEMSRIIVNVKDFTSGIVQFEKKSGL